MGKHHVEHFFKDYDVEQKDQIRGVNEITQSTLAYFFIAFVITFGEIFLEFF